MTGRLIIGVDPRNSGALVALEDGAPISWLQMPTIKVGKSSRVNAAAVAAWIHDLPELPTMAYIEDVHAMPGQGTVSMFTFGHAAGIVTGVIAGLGIPYIMSQPARWKRAAGLSGTEKDAARGMAARLLPGWRELDTKIRGQACADAALIARTGGAGFLIVAAAA